MARARGVGAVTADTCAAMLSIPGPARRDPPDKCSAGERAAFGGSVSTSSVDKQHNSGTPEVSGVTLERGATSGGDQHSTDHVVPDNARQKVSAQQVWIRHLSPQHGRAPQSRPPCKHQQQQQQRKSNDALISDPLLPLFQDGVQENSSRIGSDQFSSGANDSPLGPKRELTSGEVASLRKDFATKVDYSEPTLSTSPTVSPRFVRCKRQSRVHSADEPSFENVVRDILSIGDKRSDLCSKFYLEGKSLHNSTDTSPVRNQSPVDSATAPDVSQSRDESERQRSKEALCSDKRSSADRESVISVTTTSDDHRSDSCNDFGNKKKQKKKKIKVRNNNSDNDKSNLSLNVSGRINGRQQQEGNTDEETTRPLSACSSTKGQSRRFAKRGMFPGSNWRRLRNTLKAANEMQSTKKTKHTLNREDSFLRKFSTRNHQNVQNTSQCTDEGAPRAYNSSEKYEGRLVIQHDGNFMFYWLGVVTVSVLYNVWTPIAREAFKEIQEGCYPCWFSFDAIFDIIYILDIIVQFRTGYLDQGLMVYDSKKLRERYTKSKVIYVDFLSLLPLDLLQLVIGVHPMIRFPRFLKVYRTFRFLHMLESRTAYPNLIRVINLTHILFLGAHWFAAFYYMISEAEDFKGDWAYPKPVGDFADVNRKYLRSLFWSTLTLTTIGDLPPPDNNNEYVFVIVSYLIGVFVFATIVGQVGNVINNRNASRQEFERLLDGAKIYMQTHNVPHNLQKRVQRWYDYVWSRGRLNGCDINSLGLLPDKLKTELAIHVNLETLKKVTIFQECQPEFLHDLVLKMKAYIFTPGDLICRRGEVAREMFIIADGVVEIISESGVMLKRMGAGDFFGEIGILNLDGGINRRTADVRSVGYLELFVLSREDVLAALKDHPEAESIIRDYGQRRLREVEAHRQKVKPLKCRGGPDQQAGVIAGSQTVQNRLLQTLRSLNPTVRRQSAQANHHPGSPPAATQPGVPASSQRCVAQQCQKDSPVSRAASSIASANNSAQSSVTSSNLPAVRVEDMSVAGRFSGNYTGRRRSFGYFRTAYARFRYAFNRRRGPRRSVDDTRSREYWQNQMISKSVDDQSGHVDITDQTSSCARRCNVTLNVGTCGEGPACVRNRRGSYDEGCEEEGDKSCNEKTHQFTGVKRGSLLLPAFLESDAGRFGPKLGKGTHRKFSEPVAYMPVCTEDLDEHFTPVQFPDLKATSGIEVTTVNPESGTGHCMQSDASHAPDIPSDLNESVNCQPLELFSYHPIFQSVESSPKLSFSSNFDCMCSDQCDASGSVRGSSAAINSNSARYSTECVTAPPVHTPVSCLHLKSLNIEMEIAGGHETQCPAQETSFTTSAVSDSPAKHSPSHQGRQRSSSTFKMQATTRLPQTASAERSSSTPVSLNHCRQSFADANRPLTDAKQSLFDAQSVLPSLLNASPSPFSLSCQCDPADNFTKFISKHLPESFHQRLIRKNAGQESTFLTVHSPRLTAKYRTSSDSEASPDTAMLSPTSAALGFRSQSFPRLNDAETKESLASNTETGGCPSSRGSTCQAEGQDQFTFENPETEKSPKLTRYNQKSGKSFERQGSGAGRSHAMSIIQSPASDMSYQQITAQIHLMQGMIDKRLTSLEDMYTSTTSRLDKLAASQDTLVRLLKQLLNQPKDKMQLLKQDDEKLPSSIV